MKINHVLKLIRFNDEEVRIEWEQKNMHLWW